MRNALIALSSIGRGDLLLSFTPQPKGERGGLYGALGKEEPTLWACHRNTALCNHLRRSGLAAEKDRCGPKNGKRRGTPMCQSRYQWRWSECFLSDDKHPVQEGRDLWGFFLSAHCMASSRSHSYCTTFFSFPLKITALLSYNPQTLQRTCLKVYNSMTFHSIFTATRRCNHYHNQL